MRRGEFEDIFEECLSALLEGRRSIKESLSLYPAWRGRLESLLRAGEEIAAGLDEAPSPYARERGLQRFLEAARVKRRLQEVFPRRATTPWWRWAPVAVAAVVVIGALVSITATPMAEDGRRLSNPVSVMPYTPTPERTVTPALVQTPLERVQEQVAVLEDAVREGETVEVAFLEEMEEASSELAVDMEGPRGVELIERVATVSVVSKQYELLQTLREGSSGIRARAVAASLAAAEEVLEKLGATPTPKPEATPSPEPTPSPEATPSASATPSPGPSPTPGGEESATPSSTPTPAE